MKSVKPKLIYQYDAFISYCHNDLQFARKLQEILEKKFRKLGKKIRGHQKRLIIFRDETDLTVSPDLWDEIEKKINISRKLIVICSPAAKQSVWVSKEICAYKETHATKGNEGIIPILLEGKDPLKENTFPKALIQDGLEPFAIEFRKWKIGSDKEFEKYFNNDGIIRILAPLLDLEYPELKNRHREYELKRKLKRTAVASSLVLLFTITIIIYQSRLIYQSNLAISLASAIEAWRNPKGDSLFILQKAVEAAETAETFEAQDALHRAILLFDHRLVINGHTKAVTHVGFNPNGDQIITSSWDGTARVWETATGSMLEAYHHNEKVNYANFSPDGRKIITACSDNTARLWDAPSVKNMKNIDGYIPEFIPGFNMICSNKDTSLIATPSDNYTVKIRQTTTDSVITELRGHRQPIIDISFSGDSKSIVTADFSRTIRIWETFSGKTLMKLSAHDEVVHRARFSPDGRYVIASTNNDTYIWDVTTGKELAILRSQTFANFSPDGGCFATVSYDSTARIWETKNGQERMVLHGHTDLVTYANFSQDGRQIVTVGKDNTARVWESETGKEIVVLPDNSIFPRYGGFNPNGSQIIIISFYGTVARVWNTDTAKEIALFRGYPSELRYAKFDTDGRIITIYSDRTTSLLNIPSNTQLKTLYGHDEAVEYANFSQDGSYIVTASVDATVRVWEVSTCKEIAVLRADEYGLCRTVFNNDGSRIVTTASTRSTARVWDNTAGKELSILRGHNDRVTDASFNSDGSRIVTASWDQTARIWETATGKELVVLRGDESPLSCAGFNSDGNRILTVGHHVRVWDTATGRELVILRSPKGGWSSQASFNSDGSRIVAACVDGATRVWDAKSGRLLSIWRGHQGKVTSATFSPDGRLIVTAGEDGTVRLYYTYLDDLIKLAHSLLKQRGIE